MSRFTRIRFPLIVLVLVLAAVAPIFAAGQINLASAQRLEAEHQYAVAARKYEAAARQMPWQTDLWERAGMLAYAGGDDQGAARLMQIAARRGAISAHGWDVLGSALWTQGSRDSAIHAWQAGVRENPSDVTLLDRLIVVYHDGRDYSSEEAALRQRLSIADDAFARYRLGLLLMPADPNAARSELERAAAMNSEFGSAAATLVAAIDAASTATEPAMQSILIGRGLGLVDEWGLASRAFEHAAQLDPTSAEAWAWLGEAKQHVGQDGLPDLDRALSLNAHDSVVHVLRGLYWRRQQDASRALTEYEAAVQIEPNNPALQAALGDVRAANGDLVAALQAYQSAPDMAPTDATYWRLLALFCADNDVQVLDIGLPAAQKAAQLAPSDPQVLDTLGWTYARAGFPAKAVQTLLQAIRISPELAIAHVHLAGAYLQNGDRASAFDELNAARRLDPAGPAGQVAAQMLSRYFP